MTGVFLPPLKGCLAIQRNANIEQTSEMNKDLCYFTASETNIRCLLQIC